MEVGVDASVLDISNSGIASYLKGIIEADCNFDSKDHKLNLFSLRLDTNLNFPFKKKFYTLYRELYWQQIVLPKLVLKNKCNLLFSPTHHIALKAAVPRVITFHDFYQLRNPHAFKTWPRFYALNMYKRIIDSGCNIIVISKFTESELFHYFKRIPGKVKVIYNAVSNHWRKIDNSELLNNVKIKYRLPYDFILCVGSVEPRKNLNTLFKLMNNAKDLPPLVLVSPDCWNHKEELRLIHELQNKGRLIWLKNIPREDLVCLYNLARLFIYPSLYEGMGAPPLEAMASGCAVITSNNSALKELYEGQAILIDPLNIDQIEFAVKKLLSDDELRRNMIDRGLDFRKRFTFSKVAEETIEYFKELI